jgi:hypothetical protein
LIRDQAKQDATNFSNNTHRGILSTTTQKQITVWILLQLAENGTSQATEYPDVTLEFRISEETVPPVAASSGSQGTAGTYVGRATTLTLRTAIGLIRTVTSQRHWARYYADLTYKVAKAKGKTFAWGVANGVPSHFSYIGFDFSDYITQSLLTLQERKCIRRTTAFAITNTAAQEITEDDGVITRVGSKRESIQ